MVVGDVDPPAILGSGAGGGDVATQADQAARPGRLVHRARGTIGRPRFRGGAQVQTHAGWDANRGAFAVDLDCRHPGVTRAWITVGCTYPVPVRGCHRRARATAPSRGHSRRARGRCRPSGRHRRRSARRRAARPATASISSELTGMNRPAPVFTRCRSESGRKRLHARSIRSSSRSTIARADSRARGSVTSRTALVPSASQLLLAVVLSGLVFISLASPVRHRHDPPETTGVEDSDEDEDELDSAGRGGLGFGGFGGFRFAGVVCSVVVVWLCVSGAARVEVDSIDVDSLDGDDASLACVEPDRVVAAGAWAGALSAFAWPALRRGCASSAMLSHSI